MTVTMTTAWVFLMSSHREERSAPELLCAICILGTNLICQRLRIVPSRVHFCRGKGEFEASGGKNPNFSELKREGGKRNNIGKWRFQGMKKPLKTLYFQGFLLVYCAEGGKRGHEGRKTGGFGWESGF